MPAADEDASPTLRRLELAAALRALRAGSRMTLEQASTAIQEEFADSFSPAKLSRIEGGQQIPLPRDVSELAGVYRADRAERDRLIQLARDAKRRGWWQAYPKIGQDYQTYTDYESVASVMLNYESTFVPGLLQTRAYAETVIVGLTFDPEHAHELIEVRMKRQGRLRGAEPLRIHAILQENALRRKIGSERIMLEQIEHLQQLAELDNVTIQIVRYNQGLYAGLQTSAMTILEFPDTYVVPSVYYLEGIFWNHFVEEKDQKEYISRAFADMRDRVALSPEATKELLVEIRDRVAQEITER